MVVQIEYLPLSEVGKQTYPDVAKEVYVSDHWSDEDIEQWFTNRHSYIHGCGIKVLKVVHK